VLDLPDGCLDAKVLVAALCRALVPHRAGAHLSVKNVSDASDGVRPDEAADAVLELAAAGAGKSVDRELGGPALDASSSPLGPRAASPVSAAALYTPGAVRFAARSCAVVELPERLGVQARSAPRRLRAQENSLLLPEPR
jgi:hypothetical protein